MKNILLCIFLICLASSGCKDEDTKLADCPFTFNSSFDTIANPPAPKHPCDYMITIKNGEQWVVHAETSFGFEDDTLYVQGFGNEESLGFKFLFTGPGIYEIAPKNSNQYFRSNAYYYTTIGGDVITSYYALNETAIVEIFEYNEKEKVIKGNFEFSLKSRLGSPDPEELRFKEGTFSVHLPD